MVGSFNWHLIAQNNSSQLYLLFEFMQVNGSNGLDYQQVEEFWSVFISNVLTTSQFLDGIFGL